MESATLDFRIEPNPNPVALDVRAGLLADPGFGRVFTDHMVTIRYSVEQGWHDAVVGARGPILLDPAASVLHYAQEIFEGMKAYRLADGSQALRVELLPFWPMMRPLSFSPNASCSSSTAFT